MRLKDWGRNGETSVRVLFVGDYDMAGQSIATRLYREGDTVCWLTEERDAELWGTGVSGKVYRREITYRTCRQLIHGESIDCIVLLTAPWREAFLESEEEERTPLLALLDPVLRAAQSIKLESICLLSSVDLRKDALLPSAFEDLRAGERIFAAWCREKRMPGMILRVGCLFGRTVPERAGFAGQILCAMRNQQTVRCPFRPDASFDFLCDSDLADGFYRLLSVHATGIWNLDTRHPVTARELYGTARDASNFEGTIEFGDLDHDCEGIDGRTTREKCGWMPFYLFEDQGLLYLSSCQNLESDSEQKAQAKEKRKRLQSRQPFLIETAQNLLLFVVCLLLSRYTADWNDIRHVDIRLLYVIVVAISFGMRQGLLATVLAIAAYTATLLRSQIDISYVLYSVESWIPFIIYGVAGAFAGYWSDKKNDDYDGLMAEFQEQGDRYEFLKSLYREVVEVKNNLQKQIVISRDSLGNLYAITEGLNSFSPRTICLRTVRVLEDMMEDEAVALYLKPQRQSDYGRLMACSAKLSAELSPSIDFRRHPKLQEAMREKKLYVNTELDPDYPAMAMPVWDEEGAFALAVIVELPPDRYTVYYRNLFQTLVRIIQDNLTRAFRYQEDNRERIYLPETSVLQPEAFDSELEALSEAQDRFDYPVNIAEVQLPGRLPDEIDCRRASSLLRGTDLLGLRRDGTLWAVFLYISRDNRLLLEERFANQGFTLRWND